MAIELALELRELAREREAGEDGIRARLRVVRVSGPSAHRQLAPQDARTTEHQVETGRLREQHRIAVAAPREEIKAGEREAVKRK